ncbi:MAG: hypothetical protein CL840_17990 [Crocinitomicaceae bacterium]|nr:hypothetical protein [Crocinitomicaceae bacterium]|tara:strand:+ start:23209 stop:25509 length:2301 start_codon:yes stop_codon:yes gene_type:complete
MRLQLFIPKISFLIIFLSFIVGSALSQKVSKTEKALHKQAFEKLDLEQYGEAVKDYLQLLEMRPKSSQYNFEIGIAYLRSAKEFYKAEKYFEDALKYSTEDTIEELFFYLGKSYQNNHKFAEAKKSYQNFERFIKPSKDGAKLKAQVNWLEKTCNHGEYHVKLNTKNPLENKSKPVNDVKKYFLNASDYVILQNLGNKINSVHDDEGAVFFDEENDIFFTSKRNPFANPNEFTYGKEFEQIYVSKYQDEDWALPNLISSLKLFDSGFDDPSSQISIVAVNKDENTMILYKDELLYETVKENGKWSKPKAFPETINIKKSRQPSAYLADDGKTLIVISDKEGGYGDRDMYITIRDENGKWGELENMGSVLNTEQDEDTPFMIGDDLLYFSSKGHSSIGGYDVFFSKFKDGKWSNPQSLGIPINTPRDEIAYIRSKKDPTIAYYASARVDGYGYKDVYRITAYYKTRKREDLPSIAMVDFLSDELKRKEAEEKKKAEEKEAAAAVAVVTPPVKEEPKKEVKEEVNTVEEVKKEPEVVVAKKEPQKVDEDLFRDILFSFNGNTLTEESEEQVRKIGEYMKANPDFVISLSGHADYIGTDEVNDEVSRQRALIVTRKLVAAGVDPYNVNYTYEGERNPKADGKNPDGSDNPDGRAKNRRVEFELGQFAMYRVVGFASNSSSVGSKGMTTIQDVANFMKSNPGRKVELSGFSDSVGNAAYNKVLSEKRVSAVAEELKKLGIDSSLISTSFYGEERPSAPGTNSRRVEIRIN